MTLEPQIIQNEIFRNFYHENFLLKNIIQLSVVMTANLLGDERQNETKSVVPSLLRITLNAKNNDYGEMKNNIKMKVKVR